jgi:hypothetical protein
MVVDESGKVQTFCDLKIRQKALHEALNPVGRTPAGALGPDDLATARARRDRTE